MTRSVIPGGGEDRLGFADLASKAFAFLLPCGFTVVQREGTIIRFESPTVFINVYHGRSSYHVGLELGRIGHRELFSLFEVLRAVAPTELKRARFQATDAKVLERCLESIAQTLERNCRQLLAGNEEAFARLDSMVFPHRHAATLQAQFGAIIDRADRAWGQKDLKEAGDLYEKALPALDPTRKRRLEYLRSQRKGKGKGRKWVNS